MIKNFTLITLSSLLLVFSSSCKKELTDSSNPGGTSSYTFDGTPGGCATPVVAGFYSVGRQMDITNTLTFNINVIRKGTYSLRTTPGNGVYFAASGTFTNTGPQTIVFYGIGTPIKAGNFPFVPVTNNTCNFILTFLNGAPSAVFTYAGGAGNCTAPAISGTYASGVALGSGNYVDLAINVTSPGAYTVSTNSANGISFSRSGAFTATGAQVIRLIGNGTPATQGTFAYTPSGGCSFSITIAAPPPPASFTYNCSGVGINGTYVAGIALNSSNTVVISVNVTVAGTYSVTTSSANGVTFSASGVFLGTGTQNITLTSTDTPTAAGIVFYSFGSGCLFDITYASGPPPTSFLKCTVNGVVTNFNNGLLAVGDQVAGQLSISGSNSDGGSDDIQVSLVDMSNPLANGSYSNIYAGNTNKGCLVVYNTAFFSSLLTGNTFTVNLTSITATTATGTFSGTVFNNNGTGPGTKSITNGSFSVNY